MKRVGAKQSDGSVGDWVDHEIARLHAVVAERDADETAALRSTATRRAASQRLGLLWARRPHAGRRLRRSAGAIVSGSELPWYALAVGLAFLAGWIVVALTGSR
jgi:hypothetical protein